MFASRGLKHSLSKCNTAVELYYWYGAWVVGLMRYKESVEEYYESGRIRNCYSIFQWEKCRIRGNLNFLSLYISFFVRMGILTRKKYSTAQLYCFGRQSRKCQVVRQAALCSRAAVYGATDGGSETRPNKVDWTKTKLVNHVPYNQQRSCTVGTTNKYS